MENLPECQFQVLACQPALCQEYSDSHRPMIKKIVRLENQRATGMVFPIACPHEDLLFSSFGTKLRAAAIFCELHHCPGADRRSRAEDCRDRRGR